MLLKDYLENVNIFNLINQIRPIDFLNPLDLITLDLRLKTLQGNKTLFESFEKLEPELVAGLIVLDFSAKWFKLFEILSEAENTNPRNEITETINKTETKNATSTNIGKVSGFNSDDLLVNDGNETTGLDDATGETVRTLVNQDIDLNISFKMLNLLQQNSIIQTIVNDVAGYLTLSIYK